MADQFDPQERKLIDRLRNAPQSELNPRSVDALRARLLNAVDTLPVPAPRAPLRLSPLVPVAAIIGFLVLATIGLAALSFFASPAPITTIQPIVPSFSAVSTLVPTIAPLSTKTPVPPPTLVATKVPPATDTPRPPLITVPSIAPLFTNTPLPTLTGLLVVSPVFVFTPEPTRFTFAIIEGPVTEISDNVITIYDRHITIDPANPLLPAIRVGDVLHIEGRSDAVGNVTATTVTFVNDDVNVNPEDGTVWRDDGSCDHPPPDWAPANGWRRRCLKEPVPPGNGSGNGQGNGNNNGSGQGNGSGNGQGNGNNNGSGQGNDKGKGNDD